MPLKSFTILFLYSHTGYGIIFLFYVFANFGSMLTQNLQVNKVLYKPTVMFYLTFRIMGFYYLRGLSYLRYQLPYTYRSTLRIVLQWPGAMFITNKEPIK
jgi:hypothetical protein